jgi:hypothetical protein
MRFAYEAQARNWSLVRATRDQNINEHWDWMMRQADRAHRVDVKARKKISRHDQAVQDTWAWIELHSVRPDNRGWLYAGKATLIAFETAESFVFIERTQLITLVSRVVSSRQVTSPQSAAYCVYQRKGRCDALTLIEMHLIRHASWDIWTKMHSA